ncbi:hypothetical protein Pint_29701 [Pistacia integerrima]|nr:hypothetical protein Pint_29701 [Pistacia integerrima]
MGVNHHRRFRKNFQAMSWKRMLEMSRKCMPHHRMLEMSRKRMLEFMSFVDTSLLQA